MNLDNGCSNHHYVDSCFEMVSREENYIEQVRAELASRIDVEEDLLDLYTLLAVARGWSVTLEEVHDAWAVWRNKTNPTHQSLVVFDLLSEETQDLDREYADAIRETAKKLNVKKIGF